MPGLTLRALEQQYILQTLENVSGNRTQAARLLGISLRCLQYKLKAYRHADRAALPAEAVNGPRIVSPDAARRAVSALNDVVPLVDRRRMLLS
jgi:hypothetical protein